jgi:hypothetical protein
MNWDKRWLVLIVVVELLLLTAAIPIVRAWRYARMRASCVNGLREQSPPAVRAAD